MPPSTSRTKAAARKLDPLAKLALDALEDLKGQDITVLDVMPLTTVTDTMIICTGTSSRHVKALAQNVVEEAKHAGHQPLGVEGMDQGEWALVDLGGVVVHVMQAQARIFYQLEKLWTVPEPVPASEAAAKPRKPAADKPKTASGLRRAADKPVRKAGKAGAKSAAPAAAKKAVKKVAKKKVAKRAQRSQHLGGSGARKAAPKKK